MGINTEIPTILKVIVRWGLLYNLYADRLLGFNMFPQAVYETRELRFRLLYSLVDPIQPLDDRDELVFRQIQRLRYPARQQVRIVLLFTICPGSLSFPVVDPQMPRLVSIPLKTSNLTILVRSPTSFFVRLANLDSSYGYECNG